MAAFPIQTVQDQFPILDRTVRGRRLAYLDNAATSQKPIRVLEKVDHFYRNYNANIHRGVHTLSQEATKEYDDARETVREFLNAGEARQCIFTKGCTEGINLVAQAYARPRLKAGDEILVSTMEHHSNIVPWQIVAEQTGATVRPIPITEDGEIDLDAYQAMLSERVKVVAIVHVSNSIGTINPVKSMVAMAHAVGAIAMVDGAQAGPHLPIDVQDVDADFYTLSCHKIYAPTGVGVLYGKTDLLQSMPPYHGGGDMIRTVSFSGTTYADIPSRFEAGTPNVAGVIGLGEALKFLMGLGRSRVFEYENKLARLAEVKLTELGGIRIVGNSKEKAGIVSFVMERAHPHDIGSVLDSYGVAIRAGHHCCMPLMERFNIPATARASFAVYNDEHDVDALVQGIRATKEIFG
ncbi:MAG: cysteine desulfurase [Armatimonadetes bacterium]|nr:cysteine desulfurase [Armatimonadota bacterium]